MSESKQAPGDSVDSFDTENYSTQGLEPRADKAVGAAAGSSFVGNLVGKPEEPKASDKFTGAAHPSSEEKTTYHFAYQPPRALTPEEAREMARQDSIASRDPKNWRTFEIEDTGPNGSLSARIPGLPKLKP